METQKIDTQEIPGQFTHITTLGTPQAIYRTKTSLVFQIILAALLFGFAGITLLISLYYPWEFWNIYENPLDILTLMLPWLTGAGIFSILGLSVSWRIYTGRKKGAVVYQNGFAYSDHKNLHTWRWDDIQEITANVVKHHASGIYTGTSHTYVLHKENGEKLTFNDSLKNVKELYNHIQTHTFQTRYQRTADAYNAGETIPFGPVKISKTEGLQLEKKTYPWDQIEAISISKGVISVKRRNGGWFSGVKITAGEIPNLHIFLSIIDQIVGLSIR
jgi:hypothetical protein